MFSIPVAHLKIIMGAVPFIEAYLELGFGGLRACGL
jgi:hypothetical protein